MKARKFTHCCFRQTALTALQWSRADEGAEIDGNPLVAVDADYASMEPRR